MIARITRILILIQAILIVAFSALAIKLWHIDNFILAALIGLACVIALRITITLNNFYMASRFRSQLPNYLTLNSYQYCRLFLQEFCATMLTSSWNMPFRAFEKHVTARPIGFPVLL